MSNDKFALCHWNEEEGEWYAMDRRMTARRLEALRQQPEFAELERKVKAAQTVSDERFREVISLRAELEARTPAATVAWAYWPDGADTSTAPHGVCDYEPMAYTNRKALGCITPAAPVVAEGLQRIAEMLEGYAANYEAMARQNPADPIVHMTSVAQDIRQNMKGFVLNLAAHPVAGSPADTVTLTKQQLDDFRARVIAETVEKFAAAAPMPASEAPSDIEQRTEAIRLAHANAVDRSKARLVRDVEYLSERLTAQSVKETQ